MGAVVGLSLYWCLWGYRSCCRRCWSSWGTWPSGFGDIRPAQGTPPAPSAALLMLHGSSSECKRLVFTSRSASSVEIWYGGMRVDTNSSAAAMASLCGRCTYIRAFGSIAWGAGAAQRGLVFLCSAPGCLGFSVVLHLYCSLIAGPFSCIPIK